MALNQTVLLRSHDHFLSNFKEVSAKELERIKRNTVVSKETIPLLRALEADAELRLLKSQNEWISYIAFTDASRLLICLWMQPFAYQFDLKTARVAKIEHNMRCVGNHVTIANYELFFNSKVVGIFRNGRKVGVLSDRYGGFRQCDVQHCGECLYMKAVVDFEEGENYLVKIDTRDLLDRLEAERKKEEGLFNKFISMFSAKALPIIVPRGEVVSEGICSFFAFRDWIYILNHSGKLLKLQGKQTVAGNDHTNARIIYAKKHARIRALHGNDKVKQLRIRSEEEPIAVHERVPTRRREKAEHRFGKALEASFEPHCHSEDQRREE